MYVVFIYGPAAAGKYTIGYRVSQALDIPLFHNHLTVDLVSSLFSFGSPPFNELREQIWCDAFAAAAAAGQSFVFTFQPEASVAPNLPQKLAGIVEQRGGDVHYIELQCHTDVSLKRLDDPGRARFGKLRDKSLYRKLIDSGQLEFPPLPSGLLRIDTGETSADEAAEKIVLQIQHENDQ